VVLADCHELDHYSVFLGSETLITDLREMPSSAGRLKALYEVAARRRLSPQILAEVEALIERSTTTSRGKTGKPLKGWEKVRRWIDWISPGR
jgi:hypothetical protein